MIGVTDSFKFWVELGCRESLGVCEWDIEGITEGAIVGLIEGSP